MVNINKINELAQVLGNDGNRASKTEKTGDFANVLSDALDKKEAPEMGTSPSPALEEIESAYFPILDQSSIVTGKTDKLLGLLDTYAAQLENPRISLKSIADVLETINERADNLLKETQSLEKDKTDLRGIANQAAITARTEYIKFQRGDYLS